MHTQKIQESHPVQHANNAVVKVEKSVNKNAQQKSPKSRKGRTVSLSDLGSHIELFNSRVVDFDQDKIDHKKMNSYSNILNAFKGAYREHELERKVMTIITTNFMSIGNEVHFRLDDIRKILRRTLEPELFNKIVSQLIIEEKKLEKKVLNKTEQMFTQIKKASSIDAKEVSALLEEEKLEFTKMFYNSLSSTNKDEFHKCINGDRE